MKEALDKVDRIDANKGDNKVFFFLKIRLRLSTTLLPPFKIKAIARDSTANIQALIKDLFRQPPIFKATVTPSWKPKPVGGLKKVRCYDFLTERRL